MKVFEILQATPAAISEELLEQRLEKFDWHYEFASDFGRVQRGSKEIELLENQIFQLWKKEPERALELWQKHCPWAQKDEGAMPAFILRLQSQDGKRST